ncbi:uncharacterized protein ACLA_004150 [Aspergillus clavatus NRRL 1]|uniref:Heme haloperoxidase family profile domain-containing protein n=1 Tax=Aspergillus clavatus (strain ATCC 1007 / CBS 513.65 / DSM 816 / NCTC 3887 / NRRL 1 / QM 1276 / 107) TaxID=344612 RepID=A1C5N3_ASPCL|nr:uncharacterized protein ACLA_004150 [Aspergillus clavatus NRRL 1]EAW15001.1 hypothetical protein ACLA_004150 [Aspergillus clavatus NRRL 1]
MAIIANPEPNATFFTPRSDTYFGNNHVFNQTIFDETKAYWTGDILNASMLANSWLARQINSKDFNPTYTFTEMMGHFTLGKVAVPIIAFGDMKTGLVNKTVVEYFLGTLDLAQFNEILQQTDVDTEHERLPTHLS